MIIARRQRGTWEGVTVATWCSEWICRIGGGLVHHVVIVPATLSLSAVAWCDSGWCTDNTFNWRVLYRVLQFLLFSKFFQPLACQNLTHHVGKTFFKIAVVYYPGHHRKPFCRGNLTIKFVFDDVWFHCNDCCSFPRVRFENRTFDLRIGLTGQKRGLCYNELYALCSSRVTWERPSWKLQSFIILQIAESLSADVEISSSSCQSFFPRKKERKKGVSWVLRG